MNINEYQLQARVGSVYSTPFLFPAVGICGEVGELVTAICHCVSDTSRVHAELGDVLWYVSNLASDADIPLSTAAGCIEFNCIPSVRHTNWLEELVIVMGNISELAKKIDRDSAGEIDFGRRYALTSYMGRFLELLSGIAAMYGTTLGEVAKANIVKVEDRRCRDVVKGDGDDR